MNAQSRVVRLLFLMCAFVLLTSCSDSLQNNDAHLETQALFNQKGGESDGDALESHWTFDDADNLGADVTGQHDLLSATMDHEGKGGLVNGSAVFGENKFAVIAKSKRKNGHFHNTFKERSYSLWFKANQTDGDHYIIDEGGRINSMGIRIFQNELQASVTTRGQKNRVNISTPFEDTESWHHVVAVFNNGAFSLYLDGSLVETKNAKFCKVKRHPNGSALGARYGRSVFNDRKVKHKKGADFFYGMMDEVKIYTRALTDEEIELIYEEHSEGSGDDDGDDDGGDTDPPPGK